MKHVTHLCLASALVLAACSQDSTSSSSRSAPAAAGGSGSTRTAAELPAVREDVRGILYACPFALQEGYQHNWRADPTWVTAGWLLVLEVNPDLVQPSQEVEPVLYGGDQTLERVNLGHRSGRVIAVLPGLPGPDGGPAGDLRATTFFFGSPMLPEEVGGERIRIEGEAAAARGALPFGVEALEASRARGGDLLRLADRTQLHRTAAELVLEHSPQERELAEGLLAPLVR